MKNIKFWMICLALLIVLAPVRPARAGLEAKETRGTLCGQLAFLTEHRTGRRLLGLIPCGSSRPIIFIARPAKLYNYNRFRNAVIVKGDQIRTDEYGVVETFIEKFDSFVEIQDCRSCQEKAPTHTPIPRRASLNCGEHLLDRGQEVFPELAEASWQAEALKGWEDYAASNELYQRCGQDTGCQAEAAMLRIGETLGKRIERTAANRDRLIVFLHEQVMDPNSAGACPNFAWLVRFVTAGLSRQGFAIDTLAVGSPATLRVTDRFGRQAGLLANGMVVEEIPGARTGVNSQNKFIILPGGMFSEPISGEMIALWTASGTATLELAINRDGEVWMASFPNTAFDTDGWARLDLAGEPPWLQMTAAGGETGVVTATRFVKLSIDTNWLPSPTPWPTETPATVAPASSPTPPASETPAPLATTATAAAPPSATPVGSAAPISAPNACPLSVGFIGLPTAILLFQRRNRRAGLRTTG